MLLLREGVAAMPPVLPVVGVFIVSEVDGDTGCCMPELVDEFDDPVEDDGLVV